MSLKSNAKLLYKALKLKFFGFYYKSKFLKNVEEFESNNLMNNDSIYLNMINAFCSSSGKSHSEASKFISKKYPLKDYQAVKNSTIFNLSKFDFEKINQTLNEKGWYILPEKLDENIIDELMKLAKETPCKVRQTDDNKVKEHELTLYDASNPISILYSLPEESLINNSTIQKLVTDFVFLNICQNYLETEPIWDVTSLWWSTNFSKKSDKNAAQWFHFDMDRIKWLKVFIYLTDVNDNSGPHTFVEGTHRDEAIPFSLLAKGYNRLSDEEVKNNFNEQNFKEFTAPKGTIIIEDTRGLHKGKNVTGTHRCLLQFQMSNSLFGANYPKSRLIDLSKLEKIDKISNRVLSNYK
ncbi:MAG: hypothetical protein WBP08_08490 [Saprospiraceae bacterium]